MPSYSANNKNFEKISVNKNNKIIKIKLKSYLKIILELIIFC